MLEAIFIGFAFSVGLIVSAIGLPPLIGYLAAGFIISAFSSFLDLPVLALSSLEHIAHYGVLLLLFTVGLKLNIKKVARPEVIGTSLLHFFLSTSTFAVSIYFIVGTSIETSVMLATALSFSSTVLAAKTLEGKQELKAFHGRVAIGILIAQDLIAMVVMSIASGKTPSAWAFGLFLLPLIRPLLYKVLDSSGNEELMILFGLLLAVVVGGGAFEAVGLSGELGALAMGAIMSGHKKSAFLSERLWSLKEIFLVGFFLSIGLKGLPTYDDLYFAFAVTMLLPIQVVIFFGLLVYFKLKARSAFLTTISLTNFSEFGLIVCAAVMPEWTISIALAVTFSFIFSAPLNRFAHPIFDRIEKYASKFERNVRHPDEESIVLGDATILMMGMGKIGASAYKNLQQYGKTVGIDSDQELVALHRENGLNVQYADVEHLGIWESLDLSNLKYCVLALKHTEATKGIIEALTKKGFEGLIVAHSLNEDAAQIIKDSGADEAYITADEAGAGLASKVALSMKM